MATRVSVASAPLSRPMAPPVGEPELSARQSVMVMSVRRIVEPEPLVAMAPASAAEQRVIEPPVATIVAPPEL